LTFRLEYFHSLDILSEREKKKEKLVLLRKRLCSLGVKQFRVFLFEKFGLKMLKHVTDEFFHFSRRFFRGLFSKIVCPAVNVARCAGGVKSCEACEGQSCSGRLVSC
jgi:hypothetical protein